MNTRLGLLILAGPCCKRNPAALNVTRVQHSCRVLAAGMLMHPAQSLLSL